MEREVAYLDDVIVFDADASPHEQNIRAFVERLRRYDQKLSLSKAAVGTLNAGPLWYTVSPAGAQPNTKKVKALAATH